MPGTRHRFDVDFVGETPLSVKVVAAVLFANLALSFCFTALEGRLAAATPSLTHPYKIRVSGSYGYVSNLLGHYLDWGLWLHLILLASFFLVILWYWVKGQALFIRRS